MAAHLNKKSSHNSSKGILKRALKEVHKNPPSTLKKGQGKSARRSQMVAIAFSKARKRGAGSPRK